MNWDYYDPTFVLSRASFRGVQTAEPPYPLIRGQDTRQRLILRENPFVVGKPFIARSFFQTRPFPHKRTRHYQKPIREIRAICVIRDSNKKRRTRNKLRYDEPAIS